MFFKGCVCSLLHTRSYFFCLADNPADVYQIDDLSAALAAAAPISPARLEAVMHPLTPLSAQAGGGDRRRVNRGEAAAGRFHVTRSCGSTAALFAARLPPARG